MNFSLINVTNRQEYINDKKVPACAMWSLVCDSKWHIICNLQSNSLYLDNYMLYFEGCTMKRACLIIFRLVISSHAQISPLGNTGEQKFYHAEYFREKIS